MNKEMDWEELTEKKLDELTYGAYELKNSEGEVIYIGSGEVINRLWAHFEKPEEKKPDAKYFRILWCTNKDEAEKTEDNLKAEFVSKYGRLPKYNEI